MLDPHKGWYSAQELAGLPGMPGDESNIRKAAKKNLWASRNKLRGKGLEYALTALPVETQKHLLGLAMDAAASGETLPVPAARALPAVKAPGAAVTLRGQTRKSAALVQMDDWRRSYQDAALILCRAVEVIEVITCRSLTRLIDRVPHQLRTIFPFPVKAQFMRVLITV